MSPIQSARHSSSARGDLLSSILTTTATTLSTITQLRSLCSASKVSSDASQAVIPAAVLNSIVESGVYENTVTKKNLGCYIPDYLTGCVDEDSLGVKKDGLYKIGRPEIRKIARTTSYLKHSTLWPWRMTRPGGIMVRDQR